MTGGTKKMPAENTDDKLSNTLADGGATTC